MIIQCCRNTYSISVCALKMMKCRQYECCNRQERVPLIENWATADERTKKIDSIEEFVRSPTREFIFNSIHNVKSKQKPADGKKSNKNIFVECNCYLIKHIWLMLVFCPVRAVAFKCPT